MNNLEQLKNSIENKSFRPIFIVFEGEGNNFLIYQYLSAITKLGFTLEYIDNLDHILYSNSIFGNMIEDNTIQIYKTDNFNIISDTLFKDNLIIVCNKLSEEVKKYYSNFIIEIPKLENWQIKDWVYSICEGVEESKLDYLLDICKYDPYRLQLEMDKLSLFDNLKFTFDNFMEDSIFDDLSHYTIFNLTTAIVKKDIETVYKIYKELKNIDVEPIGLLTILYNNFKNIIKIQLTKNASPESTHIPQKQFWAIKYNCGVFTKNELIRIFVILTDLDNKIKSGEFPVNILIDYLIINILGV